LIVAAALCASPPLLHPALTGRAVVLPELRAACAEAVARVLRSGPELVVVVGPAPATGEWDPDERFDPAAFAPGAVSARGAVSGRAASGRAASGDVALDGAGARDAGPDGAESSGAGPRGAGPSGAGPRGAGPSAAGRGLLPLSLGLGAMLLDQAGYRGLRRLVAVGQAEPTDACAALGVGLATKAVRTALLVMGDGSARRTLKAPGHLDPRAEPFDAHVERAVRTGRLSALLDLDEALARDLMATGRPAWQVLAGAMTDGAGVDDAGAAEGGRAEGGRADTAELDGAGAAEVLYRDDPFGVAYLVACLHPHLLE
jgi:hypothetical protein